jgi:pyrroloquinoline quinone biosynthesis protein D
MTGLSLESRPRLAPGCRLSDSNGTQPVLLMPEGALRLNDTGRKIMQLCTGSLSLSEIVDRLTVDFNAQDRNKIEQDTMSFLTRLHEKRVLDF